MNPLASIDTLDLQEANFFGYFDHTPWSNDMKFFILNVKNENSSLSLKLFEKVDEKYTISDRLWISHQRRRQKHRANGNGFGYSLFDKTSEYTSTISARYYKDGSEILIKQKGRNPRNQFLNSINEPTAYSLHRFG